MGSALVIFQVVVQNLPMILSNIALGKQVLEVFRANGIDVDLQVQAAMADADVQVRRLLAS